MLDRDGHQVSISLLSRSSPAIACDMRIMVARSRCSSEVSTVGKCAWETCGATSGWRRVELGDLGQRTQSLRPADGHAQCLLLRVDRK